VSPIRHVTRCPHCETQFRITEDQLNAARGKARCSRCSEVFNARLFLQAAETAPPAPDAATPQAPPEPTTPPADDTPPPPPQDSQSPVAEEFDLDLSGSAPDPSVESTETVDFDSAEESEEEAPPNESLDIDALFAEHETPDIEEDATQASGEFDVELPEQSTDPTESEAFAGPETAEETQPVTASDESPDEPLDIDALFAEAETSDTDDALTETPSEFDFELPEQPTDPSEPETPETATEETADDSFDIDALIAEAETAGVEEEQAEAPSEFDFELPEPPAEPIEPATDEGDGTIEPPESETATEKAPSQQETFDFELNFDEQEGFELDLETSDATESTPDNPELTDLGFGFDTSEFDAYEEESPEAESAEPTEATNGEPEAGEEVPKTPLPEAGAEQPATTAEQIEEQLSEAHEAALGDLGVEEAEIAREPTEDAPEIEAIDATDATDAIEATESVEETAPHQEEEQATEELLEATAPPVDTPPESAPEAQDDSVTPEAAEEEIDQLFALDEQGAPVEIEATETSDESAAQDEQPVEPTDEELGLTTIEQDEPPEIEAIDEAETVAAEPVEEALETANETEPLAETPPTRRDRRGGDGRGVRNRTAGA